MPAESKNQGIATAIAEHEPKKLYKRNRGLLKMSQKQLHDFASTPRKGLPKKKAKKMQAGGVVASVIGSPKNHGDWASLGIRRETHAHG